MSRNAIRNNNKAYSEVDIYLKGIAMFKPSKDESQKMDNAITSIFDELQTIDPSSEQYTVAVKNLETLYKARATKRSSHVSPDAVLGATVSLTSLVMIMQYEKIGVIATKAFGLIPKIRI